MYPEFTKSGVVACFGRLFSLPKHCLPSEVICLRMPINSSQSIYSINFLFTKGSLIRNFLYMSDSQSKFVSLKITSRVR